MPFTSSVCALPGIQKKDLPVIREGLPLSASNEQF